jgi:hypothetical protein
VFPSFFVTEAVIKSSSSWLCCSRAWELEVLFGSRPLGVFFKVDSLVSMVYAHLLCMYLIDLFYHLKLYDQFKMSLIDRN